MHRTRVGSFPYYYCQDKKKKRKVFIYKTAAHLSDHGVHLNFSKKATMTQLHFEIVYTWSDTFEKSLLDMSQSLKKNLQGKTILTLFCSTALSTAWYSFWQQ